MGQREVEAWCCCQRTGSSVPNEAQGAWFLYLLRDRSGCGLSQGMGSGLGEVAPIG